MKLPGGGGMSVKDFFKELGSEFSRDNVGDAAAAVTYAGVMALFPFILFLVSLASVLIQPSDAERMVQSLSQFAPAEVTDILGERIRSLGQDSKVGLLTLGAVGAVWAASAGIQALMRALNITYGVKESRPWWKVKLIAMGMTVVSGALALTAAVVAIASPAVGKLVPGPLGTAVSWLGLPAAGLVMMLLWAVLYYVLPDVQQKFKFITPGSVGGVLLWVLASLAFSLYVRNFGNYDATYGSIGGIIVLLLWMWISSLVMLLGAESNAIVEHHSHEGKRAGAKSLADNGPSGSKRDEGIATSPRQATEEGKEGPRGRPRAGGARPRGGALPDHGDGAWRPLPLLSGVALWRPNRPNGHRRLDLTSIAGLVAGAVMLKRGFSARSSSRRLAPRRHAPI